MSEAKSCGLLSPALVVPLVSGLYAVVELVGCDLANSEVGVGRSPGCVTDPEIVARKASQRLWRNNLFIDMLSNDGAEEGEERKNVLEPTSLY